MKGGMEREKRIAWNYYRYFILLSILLYFSREIKGRDIKDVFPCKMVSQFEQTKSF